MSFHSNRRLFLQRSALSTAFFMTPGLFAEELSLTPSQTEGPFYPDKLPLDTDNDLLILNDSITPAVGEVTHLTGRILTKNGSPVRNAVVEIWQCDHNGAYLHSGSGNKDKADSNFQGFGRFLTNSKGEYYFRTIKPVSYPGRTPHIHFAINRGQKRLLTTQCYINGHEQNARDGVLRGTQADLRKLLMADFQALPDSKTGELTANFDVVLGLTPENA
ncbi:MAG: protocatechuate 3,4-dioxygenase [Pirellulaceae bacterium]